MEIERKFLLKTVPSDLEKYPHHVLEQGYLSTSPVVRVRCSDDEYYLTYKGGGMMAREEYNLPLTAESYAHLLEKCDGNIIRKTRYLIPLEHPDFKDGYVWDPADKLTIELDVFEAPFAPLILAEIEFSSIEMAESFLAPDWFLEDVTYDKKYHNSNMSSQTF